MPAKHSNGSLPLAKRQKRIVVNGATYDLTATWVETTHRFRIKIRLGDLAQREEGRRKYPQPGGQTLAAAFEAAAFWLEQNPDLTLAATGRSGMKPVSAWFEYWLEGIVRRDFQETTYFTYRHTWEKWIRPAIGHIQMGKVGQADLERLLDEPAFRHPTRKGHFRETGRSVRKILRSGFKAAVEPKNRTISGRTSGIDPAAHLAAMKRGPKRTYTASLEQVFALIDAAEALEPRMAAVIPVMVGMGFRRGEALGLTWGDVDYDAGTITLRRQVRRAGATMDIHDGLKSKMDGQPSPPLPMPPFVADALRSHQERLREHRAAMANSWRGHFNPLAADAPVFPTIDGQVMGPGGMNYWFEKVCDKAGVAHGNAQGGKTLHKLRHDCASLRKSMGQPDEIIMRAMRHASRASLDMYVHDTDQHDDRQAAAAMDTLLRRAG